jgi:hydrogenase expression/formation protein HypC
MCLAVPSKVISIDNDIATIDVYGARKEVNIMLLPETPQLGDFVLVHAGFAIQTIRAEAFQTGEIMHESSIAHSIIEIIDEQCAEQGCTTVDALTVRLGKATGVMPESLQFAFDALKEVPYIFACPHCGSNDFEITRGREMEISDMEMH